MNFKLTEEQVMIREAAQTFLAESCSSEAVRRAAELPDGFDPQLWQAIAQELGWCALPVAEAHGGLGLGPVELMLVQEQAGYHLLPSPFFATICLATNLLGHCAGDKQGAGLLAAVAGGECRLSAPLPASPDGWLASSVQAQDAGAGWTLSGVLERVPHAPGADALIIVAMLDDQPALFALEGDAGQLIEPAQVWDQTRPMARVRLQAVRATRLHPTADIRPGLRRSTALARLYIAAEQLGAAQRCLDLSVAYVQERKQFGRAVGSFQAVKHRCAQMMVAVENARSMVYGAAALAAGEAALRELEMDCAAARAQASEVLQFCTGEAIQLHGGVGFTWEYDPQLYFKRAQASAHWLGDAPALRAGIAAQLLDSGMVRGRTDR